MERTQMECEKKDCAFDPVEWGEMRSHIAETRDDMREIKKLLGNGLNKRIRGLEIGMGWIWGGLAVIGIIVPLMFKFL
jgi:hypothetical protein